MTAPAPSGPVERSKRMLGFYVSTGVALALFVGGWFAWTPLRVAYYARQVRKAARNCKRSRQARRRLPAAVALINMGPGASGTVEDLLSSYVGSEASLTVAGIDGPEDVWCLPLIIKRLEHMPRGRYCQQEIVAVNAITGRYFHATQTISMDDPDWPAYFESMRSNCLDWWETEGQARYGQSAP